MASFLRGKNTPQPQRSGPATTICSALLPCLMGLLFPFLHLFFLNSSNLTLPLSVHLPGLLFSGVAGWVAGIVLQLVGPGAWKKFVTTTLLLSGILLWAQSTLFVGDFGFLQGGDLDWAGQDHLLYMEFAFVVIVLALVLRFHTLLRRHAVLVTLVLVVSSLANLLPAYHGRSQKSGAAPHHTFTNDGVANLSPDQNVLIFILDTFQTDVFAEIIKEEPRWRDTFQGFTYFPNATTPFPKTYAAIPSLLTGKAFDNSQPYKNYQESAFLNGSLPSVLKRRGYDVRYRSFTWQPYFPHPDVADNLSSISSVEGRQWIEKNERTQLANLVLFRLAPFWLKPWVYNDNGFRIAPPREPMTEQEDTTTDARHRYSDGNNSRDLAMHDELLAGFNTNSAKPTLRVFHFLGVHAPLNLDAELNFIGHQYFSRKAYLEQAKGMLKLVAEELARMSELGCLDNSTVFITGDHGSGEYNIGFNRDMGQELGFPAITAAPSDSIPNSVLCGAAPLFLAKPRGADDPLTVSRAPIQLSDIPNTVFAELGFSEDQTGPSVFELAADDPRERIHRHYYFAGWGQDYLVPLTEFVVAGFSWDPDSWRLSGRNLNQSAVSSFTGTLVFLGNDGNIDDFQPTGWGAPSHRGRRMGSGTATLTLPLPATSAQDLDVRIRNQGNYVHSDVLRMAIRANDEFTSHWRLDDKESGSLGFLIPQQYVAGRESLKLEFINETGHGSGPLLCEIRVLPAEPGPFIPLNFPVALTSDADASTYLVEGWNSPEPWGTWSNGYQSNLRFKTNGLEDADLNLTFKFTTALFPECAPLITNVFLSGQYADTWFLPEKGDQVRSIVIPADWIPATGEMEVQFNTMNPRRPCEHYPDKGDCRQLGIGLQEMTLTLRGNQPTAVDEGSNLISPHHLASFGHGFHVLENWDGLPVVWTRDIAGFHLPFLVQAPRSVDVEIRYQARPGAPIVARLNGAPIDTLRITGTPWTGTLELPADLPPGPFDFTLQTEPNPPNSGTDSRILGVALSRIRLDFPSH